MRHQQLLGRSVYLEGKTLKERARPRTFLQRTTVVLGSSLIQISSRRFLPSGTTRTSDNTGRTNGRTNMPQIFSLKDQIFSLRDQIWIVWRRSLATFCLEVNLKLDSIGWRVTSGRQRSLVNLWGDLKMCWRTVI